MKEQLITFLAERQNHTDAADNYVVRLLALNKRHARELAVDTCPPNFSVGRVVPARGGSEADREIAKELRQLC